MLKQYKLTFIGLVLSVVFLTGILILDLDIFELFIESMENLEHLEIDELIIPLLIFFIFAFLDMKRRQKAQLVEIEKIKIYKAMLYSSHHVLNNFLNKMQYFKMTAEEMPEFNPKVLVLFDSTIDEASEQIQALSNISKIDEASIHASVLPQTDSQLAAQQIK